MSGKNVIFLISQPRSGSTLIQRILSNHSKISTTSEFWMALPIFYGELSDNIQLEKDVPYNGRTCSRAIFTSLNEYPNYSHMLKKHLAMFYSNLVNDFAEKKDKTFFLDKTPRYYYILDELVNYFPESRIIILYRNPFAVLNSILKTWVKNAPFFLSTYKNDIFLAIEKFRDFRTNCSSNVYHLQYEKFIEDPELEVQKVFDFLKIDYNQDVLNLNTKQKEWEFGDQVSAFKKTFIDKESLNSWKNIRSAQQWRFYNDYLQKLEMLDVDLYNSLKFDVENLLNQTKPSILKRLFTFSLNTCTSNFSFKFIVPIVKVVKAYRKKNQDID